jgi:hypothetical protein
LISSLPFTMLPVSVLLQVPPLLLLLVVVLLVV